MARNEIRIGVGTTGVGKASSEVDNLRDKFEKLQKTGAKGMAIGAGAALTTAALGAVEGALEAVGDGIAEAIDDASTLNEAMTLGAQTFEGNSREMDDWAEGAADAFGQSKAEALSFASGFGTAFKNVGMDLDEVADKSQNLTHLAADLGSAFDKGSDEAANALRSGLLGESEPLRAFGVFLDEAKTKAMAAKMGIAKLGDTLTDGQKVAARYAIIMDQTADSQGMFGRDTESLADAQKKLDAEMENVSAAIGQELLPYMVKLTKLAKDELVPALRNVATALQAVDVVTGKMPEGVEETIDAHQRLIDLLEALPDIPWVDNLLADQQALNDAVSESMAEIGREGRRGLGIVFTAAERAEQGLEHLADATGTAAEDMHTATNKMRDGVRDLEDAFVASATRILGDYYDPIELRQEQLTLNVEEGEQRAIIASKNSTKEQIRDAKHRLTQIGRRQMEILIAMGAAGDASAKELDTAITFWMKKSRAAKGQALADIRAIIRQYVLLKFAILEAAGALTVGKPGLNPGGGGGRAAGGPVAANQSYVVGEKGPELFIPSGAGSIIPNGDATSGGTPWGGGTTTNLTLNVIVNTSPGMTPGAAVKLGNDIGPAIVMYMRKRGILPRR